MPKLSDSSRRCSARRARDLSKSRTSRDEKPTGHVLARTWLDVYLPICCGADAVPSGNANQRTITTRFHDLERLIISSNGSFSTTTSATSVNNPLTASHQEHAWIRRGHRTDILGMVQSTLYRVPDEQTHE